MYGSKSKCNTSAYAQLSWKVLWPMLFNSNSNASSFNIISGIKIRKSIQTINTRYGLHCVPKKCSGCGTKSEVTNTIEVTISSFLTNFWSFQVKGFELSFEQWKTENPKYATELF